MQARDSLRGLSSDPEDDDEQVLQQGRNKDAVAWVVLILVVISTLALSFDWRV